MESASSLSATLELALARQQLELPSDQIALLDRYCRVLWKKNEQLNLTRHTDYDKFVSRDLVDSQWLESFLDAGERVLDVGTGGGVPGIILAILRPDLEVTLSDSVAKKAQAVGEIVAQLDLPVRVVHAPAQALLQQETFETLVCRAVAPISKLLTWFAPVWDSFEKLLLIKGPNWTAERDEAQEKRLLRHVRITKIASYPLPGTESESVVLQVRRT
ncbi:MAG: 16S rRNA (guanine(527)-N(7))-methyltransferase RsmG [Pirellulales bacterium]|nr:16S rRNA (guanine(527)-N(7))-methyltransferase RsmG [Pirellulales bacterium]